jgi:hypothetical protein
MSLATALPLTKTDRRTMNTGIIAQHYRVVPGFPRVWSAHCKICKTHTHKAMSPEAAERPMIQHLKDKHDVTVEVPA